MHSDDTHKKDGFFSKIFGHHDDAVAKSDDANVIQPGDAAAVGLADTPDTSISSNNEAASLDPIDFASKQSDAPAEDKDDTLQLHEVSADSSGSSGVSVQEPASNDTAADAAPTPVPADELKGSVADVLAVSKDNSEPLDLSQHTATLSTTDNDSSAPVAEEVPGSETPAAEAAAEHIADQSASTDESAGDTTGSEPHDTMTTAPDVSDGAQAEVSPIPDSSAEMVTNNGGVTEATAEQSVAQTDVEPPAPPVEEGKAWSATHGSAENVALEAKPSVEEHADGQAILHHAQEQVDQIFASHPDFTTGHESSAPEAQVTPTAKDDEAPEQAAPAITQPAPEIEAAVARLEQHIDELESGLQKVRAELASLKR